jgi:hypothetical protein
MAYTDFYWAALSLVVDPQGLRIDVEIFLIIVYSYKHTVGVVLSDGNKINNIIMINIKAVKHNDRPPNVFTRLQQTQ